ncbi:GntR family transcriptional regulator [Streptomyces sp. NBC_01696]|uniref:GntR family transcriptional regulator n=1 Tax=unclassified Streptomyces TaxID=2593676 RepID=UPI002E30EA55|nr:GntR family transcriptional regulator [Streptomyces sp. NBC_01696]
MKGASSRRHVIADDLWHQILTGRMQTGDRLASEARLASHYRVSTPTLRNALALLEAEGLVEKIHGRGNFVRHPRQRFTYIGGGRPFQPRSTGESVLRVSVRTTSLQAHGQLLDLLQVPANSPVTELLYLSHENESPHSLARIYVPGDLAPTDLLNGPLCHAGIEAKLAALRPPLVEIRESVRARPPTPEEASTLRISPALAVLVITRVGTDRTGRVVEAALLVLPGDRGDALFTTHPAVGKKEEGQ